MTVCPPTRPEPGFIAPLLKLGSSYTTPPRPQAVLLPCFRPGLDQIDLHLEINGSRNLREILVIQAAETRPSL